MVRSIAAATCGQACIVVGVQGCRNRTQAEEQNEETGKRAPHLGFMLHEDGLGATRVNAAVSYHP